MAISRKLIAQDDNDDNQWLKIDHNSRYIENDMDDWQFLFGPNSELSNSKQIVKIGAQFNITSLNSIDFAAYLYNITSGATDNAASCQFFFYKTNNPNWTETFLFSEYGAIQSNQYFYLSKQVSDFPTVDFDGGDTIAVEVVINRLNVMYRDKVYFNHLGIYENVNRLRQDVEFLEITKKDL